VRSPRPPDRLHIGTLEGDPRRMHAKPRPMTTRAAGRQTIHTLSRDSRKSRPRPVCLNGTSVSGRIAPRERPVMLGRLTELSQHGCRSLSWRCLVGVDSKVVRVSLSLQHRASPVVVMMASPSIRRFAFCFTVGVMHPLLEDEDQNKTNRDGTGRDGSKLSTNVTDDKSP
jgi:hypothetical protein